MRTIYLETTIVSYYVARPSRDLVIAARQQLTREWWDNLRQQYRLVASVAVREEAVKGDQDAANRRMAMLSGPDITFLDALPEIDALAERVRLALSIPEKKRFDALHMAYAIWYEVDFLLTWNCTHFANSNMMRQLVEFCRNEGLWQPVICTPDEMVGCGEDVEL